MRNLKKNRIIKFIQDNGGYFAITGALSMTLSALISLFWNYSVNPNFNIVSFAVSDLVSGPMISGVIYTIGLIISSFIQLPTYISLVHCFNKKETYLLLFKITTLSSILSIISHNILSVVPLDRNILPVFIIHGFAAGIHYVTGSISLISIGIIELKKIKVSKIIPIISFIVGGLYSIVWIRFLLSLLLGIPDIVRNHAIQWFGLIGIISWTIIHGIFLIRVKNQALS